MRAAWNYETKTTTFVIDIALQYHFFRTLPRFWNGSFDPTSLRREASLFNLAGALGLRPFFLSGPHLLKYDPIPVGIEACGSQ
jgi:hypothetical protein